MTNQKMPPQRISKSRLLLGLQCPKALYFDVYNLAPKAKPTPGEQYLFDQGTAVGKAAQSEWPNGMLITAKYYEHDDAIAQTREAVSNGSNAIFEATFAGHHVIAKIDILAQNPASKGWDIVEVKSSTSVKPEHIDDVALQTVAAVEAGVKVERSYLQHINNKHLHPKDGPLFTKVDITDEVTARLPFIQDKAEHFAQILSLKEPPKADIGPHCSTPYECKFYTHCSSHLPKPSIFDVPRMGATVWNLYNKGVVRVEDLDLADFKGTRIHHVEAIKSKSTWINKAGIKKALETWQFPLHYLDFETIGPALPLYHGTRPYQAITFQFSCHVEAEDGTLAHREYLHDDATDPRPALVAALLAAIGDEGSIVSYNAKFEAGCIKALAKDFPDKSDKLLSLIDRLVDPLTVFQNHVYDYRFGNSFSLKSVAPAILGDEASYRHLTVGDGTAAQLAFLELISNGCTPQRKLELRSGLLTYCRQDTEVMVKLVRWLREQAQI
jgi:hypothetical protein